MPVTLPPGRARLSTKPAAGPGSIPSSHNNDGNRLGRILGRQDPLFAPAATMISTLSRTSSAASSGSRSRFPWHIGTRWRYYLCSHARAEPPELPRNGRTH